jgi:CcmD family protein
MLRRATIAICSLWWWLTPVLVLASQPSPSQQNEYVPIDQLPPRETLPAAPLLIAAYIVVWMALMFYLWSIWRRLGKVEAEMQALQRRTPGSVH